MNSPAAPPSAVVFDVGGVLAGDLFGELEQCSARFGLPPRALVAYFLDDVEFTQVETGRAPVADFLSALPGRVLSDHGVEIDMTDLYSSLSAARPFRPEMLALAAELAEGHRVAVLSNNVSANSDYMLEHLAPPVFEFIVNSAEVGMRKPEPGIYEELLRRLGIPAHEVVFVDDLEQNLVPAAKLGMGTVHFQSESQCRAALHTLGARCRP